MHKRLIFILFAFYFFIGIGNSHAQEKFTMIKMPFDLVYQHNKSTYGNSFIGMAVGLGIERYIFEQATLSLNVQSIQNFTVLGIVPFLYLNPEFRYYLKVKNFSGMYLGASFGYGFDDFTRYITYSPVGGYQFYLLRSWYLDASFSIGSGNIRKIDAPLLENSDGVFFRAGFRIGKAF